MQFKKAAQNDIKDLVALRIEYLLEDYGKISDDKLLVISENLPTYFTNHLNKDLFVFVGLFALCF